MTIFNTDISLSTATSTLVLEADKNRRYVCFTNTTGGDIYVGGAGVTDLNGIVVKDGTNFVVQQNHPNDKSAAQAWYAYDAAGTSPFRVAVIVEDSTS